MIKFYGSLTCPKCSVIEAKLKKKNINFEKEIDADVIMSKGLKSIPWIELEDGTMLDFKSANEWINKQEVAE